MVLNSCQAKKKEVKITKEGPESRGGKIALGHKIRFSKIVYLFKIRSRRHERLSGIIVEQNWLTFFVEAL